MYQQTNKQMVQGELTLKAEALGVLEVPTGATLQDTEVGKNFENSTGISPSNNRWDYMKIKIFCRAKQRPSREEGKLLQSHFKREARSQNLQRITEIKCQGN